MFFYHLRLGWKSLLRTPVLTLLALATIALGIAGATTFVTTYHLLSSDPLPHKSDKVFYVRLDAWDPQRAFDDDHPERPPDQLTWRDAVALLASEVPERKTATYRAQLFVHPELAGERPFEAQTRLCTHDFFALFELPFAHGGPWSQSSDDRPEAVVVIDDATNTRLFGGGDSVGRKIRIAERTFTITGVLAPWRPALKFFDVHNGAQNPPEALYLPLFLGPEMQIESEGNTSNWTDFEGFEGRLASEAIWIQFWAELENAEQRQAFQTFIDAHALAERQAGRFQRPLNNQLQPLMEWLEEIGAVPPEARSLMVISLLLLVVCSINLIGLLLSKFLARAPEVGVRRALGASRRTIFFQHLVECQLVAVLGGGIGITLAAAALGLVNRYFAGDVGFDLDLDMVATAVALAVLSGLFAGLYPAWRICATPPATHLKLQ